MTLNTRKSGNVSFHKLVVLVLEDFSRRLSVIKQLVDFLYLLPLYILFALDSSQQTGGCQQLYSIPKG